MSEDPDNAPDTGSDNDQEQGGDYGRKSEMRMSPTPIHTVVFWLVVVASVPLALLFFRNHPKPDVLKESEFVQACRDNRVVTATKHRSPGSGNEKITGLYQRSASGEPVEYVSNVIMSESLDKVIDESSAIYDVKPGSNMMSQLLLNMLPILVLVVIIYLLFARQIRSAGKAAMQFGKSRARMFQADEDPVTFDDVAGIEEAKEDIEEIVDFLKDPDRYHKLGGKIPKGVLMVGAPGTGKTLLARAIAGEASVPFYSISGSDFVEMFVGVGASRVRDMFEQAKRNSPCIVFIDEIDAVGRSRFSGIGGGHDEREQTLNALLVEMDGFEAKGGVIVVAATNRPDVLDPALLRPGRFDRQIHIDLPDVKGRLGILEVHAKNIRISDAVDLNLVARGTPGLSGADLANIINEAALLAARLDKEAVEMSDLMESRDKVRWGKERRSRKISDQDRKVTAYHEAGHALISIHCPDSTPLHKVTIVPRGSAYLGATMHLPLQDRYTQSIAELEDELAVLMGGRCAEELIMDSVTSGASMDIRQATDIARKMVCEWGMSKNLGLLNYGERSETIYLGRDITRSEGVSDQTARLIDKEVKDIIDRAHDRAKKILSENIVQLKLLGSELLEKETLDAAEIYELLCMELPPDSISTKPMHDADPAKEDSEDSDDKITGAPDDDSLRSPGLNQPGIA